MTTRTQTLTNINTRLNQLKGDELNLKNINTLNETKEFLHYQDQTIKRLKKRLAALEQKIRRQKYY